MFKIANERVTRHFFLSELACRDGTINAQVIKTCIEKLEPMRSVIGVPFILNSAYRSPEYNEKIGGASQSKHMEGIAFDIAWTKSLKEKFGTMEKFKEYVETYWGVKGFGFYDTFVHIDWREEPATWDGR